ncbi:PTS sugar transporter subunit IIA [Enterococcus termitis]|uniref:Sugar permease n=1 Tax=Enterococcus termitis TaxID=332950 RepID=A0A1E5GDB4_9ENTE|nr:PTS glucose transporter subunit IIA [Enterococcus termitis]OEG10682.1 sugar permease [Enterococcus termitis]OJG96487.1 hypothetical protein RV18_GL002477 [Enterococcus termitis]
MRFFKKKRVLKSIAEGRLVPLTEVNDAVFSKQMMGIGFAVTAHSGQIYAPVSGKILSIFPTLHAITLESENGDTLLIHLGLDTVELNGAPFTVFVQEGATVNAGQKLAEMDLSMLAKEGKDPVAIVVLPEVNKGELIKENILVSIEDDVFRI